MDRLESGDPHVGMMALRGTLHALRDRIGPENAIHLGAQLPTLVRGIYYEAWQPARAEFDDPDVIVAIETVDTRASLSL